MYRENIINIVHGKSVSRQTPVRMQFTIDQNEFKAD